MKRHFSFLLLFWWAVAACGQIHPNEIRVARGSEDYPPYEMHVDGKLVGIHVEVVEAVAARIGHRVLWSELPWPRAQRCVEFGECDAISYISRSPAREQWGRFLPNNVLSQVEMRFMIHKDNADKIFFDGNVQAFLTGKTLFTLIGYNYGPDVAKAQKYEVKDLATMAAMMKNKRYDVAVINVDDFFGLKSRDDLVLLDPTVWVSKAYLAFSKKANNSADLAAKFQASYVDFRKTKDYAAIIHRHQTKAK